MARVDRLELEGFLSSTEDLIEAIIYTPADSDDVARLSRIHWRRLSTSFRNLREQTGDIEGLLDPGLNELARAAWSSWKQREVPVEMILGLDRITNETVTDDVLEAHGLTGPELDFKLQGFYRRPAAPTFSSTGSEFTSLRSLYAQPGSFEWANLTDMPNMPPLSGRRRFFRWRLRQWLADTLEWADVALDSFAFAVPMLDPLKEVKKAVVAGLKDSDDSQ